MNGLNCTSVSDLAMKRRPMARDDEMVTAAQAGSPGAFAELHTIYSGRLYKTIISITRNPEDAEDALQDTFLRAYLALNTFEGRASIYSWLTRIAVNCALMVLRKRRGRAELVLDPLPNAATERLWFEIKDSAPNPEQICEQRQRRVRLQRAIRNLGPSLREPIRMRLARECSIKEIGRALKISTTATKTRLHRARVQLCAACGDPGWGAKTPFRHLFASKGP
jgi:RNA polymerase sigma-70 factor, ECF subfamily